jgi:hypothetical protein
MRNLKHITLLSSLLFTMFSCSSDDKDVDVDPGTITNPVEEGTANTAYKPAFAGQTRINGVKTNTDF